MALHCRQSKPRTLTPSEKGPHDYNPVIRVPTWFIIYSRLHHDLGLLQVVARISGDCGVFSELFCVCVCSFQYRKDVLRNSVGLKREMLQLHLKLQQFNLSFRALIQSGLVLLVERGLTQGDFARMDGICTRKVLSSV